jgi:4-alpha-glucanotransferase
MRRYLGGDGRAPNWELIRGAWMSVCDLAIVPAQDLLGLGSEARMNRPGIATGNWRWRMAPGMPGREIAERLRDLTALYGR